MTIIIESMNGEKEVMRNRFLQREENRNTDLEAFEFLITQPISKLHDTQPYIKSPNSNRRIKDPSFDFFADRGNKIVSTICRLLPGYPGFEGVEYDDISTVSPEMIARVADAVVNGGDLAKLILQLMMCREPNRQTSDEIIQYEIRKKYLGKKGWTVNNLTPGYKTLGNGDWIFNDAATVAKAEDIKARSIDFEMSKGNIIINDFSKFALVAGGGQSHQMKESKYFLAEVKKYIDKHNDNVYFADTLDGAYAEKFIESHRELLKGYEHRVFVGNTEQVITWAMTLTK
jgi:hypothetical protein